MRFTEYIDLVRAARKDPVFVLLLKLIVRVNTPNSARPNRSWFPHYFGALPATQDVRSWDSQPLFIWALSVLISDHWSSGFTHRPEQGVVCGIQFIWRVQSAVCTVWLLLSASFYLDLEFRCNLGDVFRKLSSTWWNVPGKESSPVQCTRTLVHFSKARWLL